MNIEISNIVTSKYWHTRYMFVFIRLYVRHETEVKEFKSCKLLHMSGEQLNAYVELTTIGITEY